MKTKWMLRTFAGALFAVISDHIVSNPTGGAFAPNGGSGSIVSDPGNPNTLIINQDTEKGVINWNSFGNQSNETIRFNQPGPSSITLNNVIGVDPSVIQGRLEANGNVWIVNPNGIQFGPTARVDVAGLLATTAIINKDDFMNGHYRFVQDPNQNNAVLVQQGAEIRVQDTGMVALVAPGVSNRGLIVANLGKVYLGSGLEYTVDLYGDNLIHFAVANGNINQRPVTPEGEILNDAVHNGGHIIAHGGHVVLNTDNAKRVVENVVNMEGVIEADTAVIKGTAEQGEIVLRGGGEGKVIVTGKMNASGRKTNAKGGTAKVLGDEVIVRGKGVKEKKGVDGKNFKEIKEIGDVHNAVINVSENETEMTEAVIDVSGNAAKATDIAGGKIFIGGNKQGKLDKDKSFRNSNSTEIGLGAKLIADADKLGSAGEVIVWSDGEAKFYGQISVQGGLKGGDAGFIETSGKGGRGIRGGIDLGYGVEGLATASQRMNFNAIPGYTRGEWLLDPFDITIENFTAGGQNGSFNGGNPDVWTPSGSPSIVAVIDVTTALELGTSVTIQTSGGGGAEAGNISMIAPITIAGTSGFSPTFKLAADGDITFSSSFNVTSGTVSLDCTAGGAITFSAPCNFTAGGNISAGGAVQIGSNLTFAGATTISGASFNGAFLTALDTTGNPLSITTTGLFNPTGGLIARASDVSFTGAGVNLNDGRQFAVQSTGSLTVNGTTGAVSITNGFTATAISIIGNGFSSTGDLTATAGSLSVDSGSQRLSMAGHTWSAAGSTISLAGTGFSYNIGDSIVWSGTPGNLIINGRTGTVTLNQGLPTSSTLSLSATNTNVTTDVIFSTTGSGQTFNTNINCPPLTLTFDAGTGVLNFSGSIFQPANLFMTASQMNIVSTMSITTVGGGGQTYGFPIDGPGGLTLNAGAANPVNFSSNIGGVTPLASFTVSASEFAFPSSLSITTNGGGQTYNTPIDGTNGSEDITLQDIGGGTITLTQTIGNIVSPNSVTITAGDTFLSGTGINIFTNGGGQAYNTAIDGGQNLLLQDFGTGTITLNGSIGAVTPLISFETANNTILGSSISVITNGGGQLYDTFVDGTQNLTIQDIGGGTISFFSSFGSNTPLSSLTVTAADLLLQSDLSIITNGAGQTYSTPLDGAVNLTLNVGSGGTLVFNSNVGGSTPLSSITVVNANNLTVNNGSVITTGAFTQQAGLGTTAFGNSLVSSTPVTIVTGVLTGSITAPAPLTLTANSCNITGTIGGLTAETISGKFPVFLTNNATASTGLYFFNGRDIIFGPAPTPNPPFQPTQMNQAVRGLISQTASQGLQGLISALSAVTAGLGGGGGANQNSVLGFGTGTGEGPAGGTVSVESTTETAGGTGTAGTAAGAAPSAPSAAETTNPASTTTTTTQTTSTTTPTTTTATAATSTEATSTTSTSTTSTTSGTTSTAATGSEALTSAPSTGGVAQASQSGTGTPGTGTGSVAGEPVAPGVSSGSAAPATPLAPNAPLPPSQTANLAPGSLNRETPGSVPQNLEKVQNTELGPFGSSRSEGTYAPGSPEAQNTSFISGAGEPQGPQPYRDNVLQNTSINSPLSPSELKDLLGKVYEADFKNLAVELIAPPGAVTPAEAAALPSATRGAPQMRTPAEVEGFNGTNPGAISPDYARIRPKSRYLIPEIYLPVIKEGSKPLTPEESVDYDSVLQSKK